jgi:hypothetical protein
MTTQANCLRATRVRFAILVFFFPAFASAQQAVWKPRVEFKLEDASYAEALTWVSGYAYALTEVGRGGKGTICLSKDAVVESQVLLEALNIKFKGQRITSEQAAREMFATASANYACAK